MNGNYKKRAPIYHSFSHFFGLGYTIYAAVKEEAGSSLITTCFIRENS